MSVADTKPEPIRVGVEGIKPTPIELTPARLDWRLVAALPPFQMFVHELAPCPPERDQQQWATEYAVRDAAQRGDQPLFDQYAEWHAAKGYWPNETPMGDLKQANDAAQ